MKNNRNTRPYYMLIIMAFMLSMATFTPLVMPYGVHTPTLFHLPYTLWTGLITALLFVLITWLAVRVHPGKGEDES